MVPSLQAQIQSLRRSMEGLEAQRDVLGDSVVNPALAALRQQLAMLEQQAQLQATPFEERRLVTILFVDIVGSTSLAEKLDPEEWRQVVSQVHKSLGGAISSHHGEVIQYLGDGLLALFGSHQGNEHDAENAIRAALDGHASVTALLLPHKIQLRAGIHSGLVVVGELGDAAHKEFTASGDAMNLAARLQTAAPAGGTLISHDTYRYVRGIFDLTPQPSLPVKGKIKPIQTYLVRRAKPRAFRSVTRGVAGVETRTIGRDTEIQILQQAYLRAFKGHGLVWAQLLGEPGVGKTRLMSELTDWLDLRDETFRLMRARAMPDDVNQPFALVRRLWFDRFQIAEDAPLEQAENKWVERFMEFSGLADADEPAHALGLLVGLPFKDSPHIKGMRNDPNQVKGRSMVVSLEMLRAVRQAYPVVLLLEDLQWCDPASWDYLMDVFLAEPTGDQPNGLFILGAARKEWHPPQRLDGFFQASLNAENEPANWGIQIVLAPLSNQAIYELAGELLQRVKDAPEELLSLLVERSEGVPYFTEEMVNWFIDHGILETSGEEWGFLPDKFRKQPLPATLQHLLQTRLSSLSLNERAALQRGSIFGRHFWTRGVEALGITYGEETFEQLQPRGFVDFQPESAFEGDIEWSFHHNILQEVTYESILKRERASLHKVAAAWLEGQARQAGRLEEFAGLLGDHCERAGELSAAADWYILAGMRAFSQGAPREARHFYTQALALIPQVDHDRHWQALSKREEANMVLNEADAWKADVKGLEELAQAFEDANYAAEAYLCQSLCYMRTGEEAESLSSAMKALQASQICENESIEAKAFSLAAVININQHETDAARENIKKALQIARRLGDDNVLSFVLFRVAFVYSTLGDTASSDPYQIEQVELDHRLGNRSLEAIGLGNLGGGYLILGLHKKARPILEQARAINESLGANRSLAYNLATLGELYLDLGDLRKAHQMYEQAYRDISASRDTRGIIYILNGLGYVILAMQDASGARIRFTEALDIAENQGLADLACEARVGLASSAVLLGNLDEAGQYINAAWSYIKEYSWLGMDNPLRMYHKCAETFDALGDAENLQSVLDAGYQAMMEVADMINNPEWRHSFLQNNPNCRSFLELWERMQH
jgi:class 3 adenylate cyclase/tetratricopeptide (TPR) repeat protein